VSKGVEVKAGGLTSFGVDTGLVSEGTETGDVVVERDVDLDVIGNEILNFLELLEVVLAEDIITVGRHHPGHEATKGRDTVSLPYTEDGCINVRSAGFQGAVSVGNSATSVVMEVRFDVAAHNTSQRPDQVIHLPRAGTSDGISNADSVHTNLVDSTVDREKVDEIGPERVFRREADFFAFGLDKLNDLNGSILDVCHVLAMRVFAEIARRANDDIKTVDTSFDCNLRIFKMATNVGENLGLQPELTDGLAITTGLLAGSRTGELDVVDTKLIKCLRNLDFGVEVKVGTSSS